MKGRPKKVNECYIVYFDILGYKQYFEDNEEDYELLDTITHMIADVKLHFNVLKDLGHKDIHIKAFSDNVIVCVNCNDLAEKEIYQLGFLIAYIEQYILVRYNLLLRGGFTKGKIYFNSDIVYGKGLIRAVELENKAKFPRIIVDQMFTEKNFEFAKHNLALQDIDGQLYLDYFLNFGIMKDHYKIIRKNIINQIKKYGKYNNLREENNVKTRESIIQKILWVVEKYNQSCDVRTKPDEKIKYHLEANSVLLKMEIHLDDKRYT